MLLFSVSSYIFFFRGEWIHLIMPKGDNFLEAGSGIPCIQTGNLKK